MALILSTFRFLLTGLVGILTLAALALVATHFYITPSLPPIESIREIQLQLPLRIYTQESRLLGEFGEKRRYPAEYSDFPDVLIKAILAAEDDRFFEHPGVDYHGLVRATMELARTGKKRQGGSTITMQVARNVFLTREKTYIRKLREIFLALRIERELSKEEILTLYLNKIYLGHRSYGVVAASRLYYGVPLDQLSVAQAAMIAGIPKAPSRNNPISSPARALGRRNYILGRMAKLGYIDHATHESAIFEKDEARLHTTAAEIEGPYAAEMVRAEMIRRFGDAAYTAGYSVYTTIQAELQQKASSALRTGLMDYDKRHGYLGAEQHVELDKYSTLNEQRLLLNRITTVGNLRPALVTAVAAKSATAVIATGEAITIAWEGMSWARRHINANSRKRTPKSASDILRPGDIVRVTNTENKPWKLSQIPELEGALVSLRANDGAIRALTGGFDYYHSKYNRATQTRRQPGSNFKPFIYSAALENGFTAASIINDAPVVFDDATLENTWRPENYSGRFHGPTRLREALTFSRNLVSIRLLRAMGIGYTIDYIKRFGFKNEQMPRDLSLALGSGGVAPMDLAAGYAVFANGGYKVEPYIIARIVDTNGIEIFAAKPATACKAIEASPDELKTPPDEKPSGCEPDAAPAIITPQNAYLMSSMMHDVIERGTGKRARELKRTDLAGKTGTTNDQKDAWFSGFNREIVTTVWVGFDDVKTLGRNETGGKAALPIWIDFMATALEGMPAQMLAEPPGMVTVRIDSKTGRMAHAGSTKTIFEMFREENAPEETSEMPATTKIFAEETPPEQLF